MDQDALKSAVRGLTEIVLEHHRQIEMMRVTLEAVQQTLDDEARKQIDLALRPWRRTSDEPLPSADATLEQLRSLLQQLDRK